LNTSTTTTQLTFCTAAFKISSSLFFQTPPLRNTRTILVCFFTAAAATAATAAALVEGNFLQGAVNCYNGKFQSCFGVSEFLKFLLASIPSVISSRALRMTAPGVSRVSSEFQEVSRVSCEFQAFQEMALETLETKNNFKSFKSSFKSYS